MSQFQHLIIYYMFYWKYNFEAFLRTITCSHDNLTDNIGNQVII